MTDGLRVAVTGASGYLGRPLVAALAADDGVAEVRAIDLRPPARQETAGAAKLRPIARDVRDPELARDLDGAHALMHLAFRVLGRGTDAWSVNVDGSRNAFAAAARAGVGTIVHASSAAAYGCAPDNPVPLTEDSPLRPEPAFYYTQTKVAVERVLDEFEARNAGVRVVRIRQVGALGPRAPLPLGGRAFVSLSDFDPPMQFVWLADTADAFVRALHSDAHGAFNIGAPDPVRSSQVAGLVGVRSVRLPHRVLRPLARLGRMHPGWVDMARYPIVVDAARARAELGWQPTCDTAETLLRLGALLRGRRRRGSLATAQEVPQ